MKKSLCVNKLTLFSLIRISQTAGMVALCWIQLLTPALAGERIPPYAIEASALLHQIKQRVPDLRTSKFGQRYENLSERNLRADAIPFTAGGMLCQLESKEEYCIAFEIGSEVKQRPMILEQIMKILTDPCAEISYPTKNFSDLDKDNIDYWHTRLDYTFKADQVKRIYDFFKCSEPSRTHYEIIINVVKNLDGWMVPTIPRGAETKKKLLENLVEQIIIPVY
ncbi:hypothetical protein CCP3SC1_180010 [Gammaproteobacteria bacterium]